MHRVGFIISREEEVRREKWLLQGPPHRARMFWFPFQSSFCTVLWSGSLACLNVLCWGWGCLRLKRSSWKPGSWLGSRSFLVEPLSPYLIGVRVWFLSFLCLRRTAMCLDVTPVLFPAPRAYASWLGLSRGLHSSVLICWHLMANTAAFHVGKCVASLTGDRVLSIILCSFWGKWQAGGPAHARDFKAVLCKRFSLRASQKQETVFQLPTLLPEPSCRGKAFPCDWKNMYYVCGGWQLETDPEFIRPEFISRGRRVGDRPLRCFPAVP